MIGGYQGCNALCCVCVLTPTYRIVVSRSKTATTIRLVYTTTVSTTIALSTFIRSVLCDDVVKRHIKSIRGHFVSDFGWEGGKRREKVIKEKVIGEEKKRKRNMGKTLKSICMGLKLNTIQSVIELG